MNNLRETTIGKLKDTNIFYLSKRMKTIYKIIIPKKKGKVTYTSAKSGLSFERPADKVCYV